MTPLAIIGAGGWGTALSVVLAPRFPEIRLWVFEPDLAARMRETRDNDVYLPGIQIPSNVIVVTEFAAALDGAGIVLGVTPSHVTRAIYQRMLPHLQPSMLFVSATKGLETKTLVRMSEVIRNVVGQRFPPRVAVLSGPTFAREVAAGEPTAVVVSSTDATLNETRAAGLLRPGLPPLHQRRPDRRRVGGRAQERSCHRRRRLERAGPGQQRHCRADHPRPGRNHPAGGGRGRATRAPWPASPDWATWC